MALFHSAPNIVVVAGQGVVGDESLVRPVAKYLRRLLAAGQFPVLIGLVGSRDGTAMASLELFARRLADQDVDAVRCFPSRWLAFMANRTAACIPFVLPDIEMPSLTDKDAIDVGDRLGCGVVFLTKDGCIETAESPLLGGGDILEHMSFNEAMEMTQGGTEVITAEAVQLAWSTNTPFKIFSLDSGRWTAVTHDAYEKRTRPLACITVSRDLTFVTGRLEGGADSCVAGAPRDVLAALARQGVRIEQLQLTDGGLTFACDARDADAAAFQLRRAHLSVTADPCARLCAIGAGLRHAPGVVHTMLVSLDAVRVRPLHISDSAVTVTIVVREEEAARAELALRRTFLPHDHSNASPSRQIAFDVTTRTLRVRERSERLGLRQAELLHLLIHNAGKTVEIESAARSLFGNSEPAALAAVRVHIHNLRKKLEDDPVEPEYILTIPHRGYTFARLWSGISEDPSAIPPSDQPVCVS